MKFIVSSFLLILCVTGMNSQKIIDRPTFKFSTAPNLMINQIEMRDSSTIINFTYKGNPGVRFSIPKGSCINDIRHSDQKLYVKKADRIQLGKWMAIPASGEYAYTLHFPPLAKDVQTIDFGENNDGGSWFVYGIQLHEENENSLIPSMMQGKWLNKLSGDLKIVLYPQEAFYKGKRWKYGNVTMNKKGKGTIELIDDQERIVLYVASRKGKAKYTINDLYPSEVNSDFENATQVPSIPIKYVRPKEGEFSIGESTEQMWPLCKKDDEVVFWGATENQLPFKSVEWSNDSAIYEGCINGYSPRYGEQEVSIYVNNIIAGTQDEYSTKLSKEGMFSIKVPVLHPQTVYVRSNLWNGTVYLEPGEKTFQIFGREAPYFMGSLGKVNNDLLAMSKLSSFSSDELLEKVLDMDIKDFVAYHQQFLDKDLKAVDIFASENHISPKALQIKKYNLQYMYTANKFAYSWRYEYAYRKKHNISRELQRRLLIEIPSYTKEDLSFINSALANNQMALVGGSYDMFIHRLKYSGLILSVSNVDIFEIVNCLERQDVSMTEEEHALIDSLNMISKEDDEKLLVYQDQINAFTKKYENYRYYLWLQKQIPQRNDSLRSIWGIEEGLVSDIFVSQDLCRKIVTEYSPMENEQLEMLLAGIKDPFIAQYVRDSNRRTLAAVEANKGRFQTVYKEMPIVENDSLLFDAIMKKYRGKVVYVDFWATWCGPCRSGIKRIAPLKEQMVHDDVVFVYISANSSPQGAYVNMIPEIKGEHYKANKEQWQSLCKQFEISGIPHYVLVNKEGKVVKNNFRLYNNEAVKKLISSYF